MMEFLGKAKRYLWAFVELGFASILLIMLIYLILGQGSGVFVLSVADNVTKFATAVPTSSLIGLGLLLGHPLSGHETPALGGDLERPAMQSRAGGGRRSIGVELVTSPQHRFRPTMPGLSRRMLLAAGAASLAARGLPALAAGAVRVQARRLRGDGGERRPSGAAGELSRARRPAGERTRARCCRRPGRPASSTIRRPMSR